MAIKDRFNDPNLGAAFENIASLFAPVSSQELAGYATADLTRQKAAAEAQRMGLVDMFTQGGDDRIGVAAGLYAPTQSYQALQMGDATDRRGQDIESADRRYGYDTSLAGTQYTADQGLRGDMYSSDNTLKGAIFGHSSAPLAQGEIRNVDPAIVEWATGIPGLGINQAGAPKPLTDAEVKGQALLDADPAFRQWAAGGSKDPLAVLGPDGPVMMAPDQAAGMGVYEKPSEAGAPKLTNARLPDGTQTTALQTPQGLVDPQTGQVLPSGTTMFSTAAQGSADDVGLGKTPVGKWQQELVDIETTTQIGDRLTQLLTENPASQGMVGWMRGTAQDMIQTGNEVGAYFGGTIQSVAQDVAEGVADAALLAPGGAFDPSLPAIEMLMNTYIYNVAKATTGERLTNEAVKQWRQSMGGSGAFANQASTLARIAETQKTMQTRGDTIRGVLSTGQMPAGSGTAAPPAAPPPSTPAVPAVGTVEDGYRFLGGNPSDPASWEPVQ